MTPRRKRDVLKCPDCGGSGATPKLMQTEGDAYERCETCKGDGEMYVFEETRLLSIGEVSTYTEEQWNNGSPPWRGGLTGGQRFESLIQLYRGEKVYACAWNPFRIVTRDMINWETSSIPNRCK